MYLSNIEIVGFKSFAQRVNVKFDTGVTAIVGPNGCGKTNIVDAIRWALGEQKYSTLRSDKMEDVIFNGTKNRKPLGLAEVSLTIQNTKGILPTEYTEVTITRRVFRSGESEYLMNKVPCRLKDILDLFMDTGMGADAYSVIELKMVETILSDKTDERRKLFEEAAGVTKYKYRRKAAYRKLEEVQKDLLRVNDIVKEVQKTVSSLERQAKKAEQYNDVSSRLRALEIDLLERENAYLHAKLHPLEEQFVLAKTDKHQIDETLRQQEAQLDELRAGLSEIEKSLIEVQRSVAAHLETLHRHEEKILIANERRNSLSSNIQRYEKEKEDLRVQNEKLQLEKLALEEKLRQLEMEYEDARTLYAAAKDALMLSGKQLDTKKAEVQSFNDTLLDLAHTIVTKRGEHERFKTRIDNLRGRIDRSQEEIELYSNDIRENEERVTQLTVQDKELRRRFVAAEMESYEHEKTKKALKEEVARLQKRSLALSNDITRRNEKIDFLRGLIESNEGFSEAAKYLLTDERWKSKHFTTVVDIVQAPEKYRVAVEAALGEAASFIIAEKIDDAVEAVNELKKLDKGKATFVCLQRVPSMKRKGKKRAPTLVWAVDQTQCKSQHRGLISFLLDGVAIVENLGEANKLLATMAGIRCVTLDGQWVTSAGVLRGGSQRLDEGGRIGKESQIESFEMEINQLKQELSLIDGELTEKSKSLEGMDSTPFTVAVKTIEKEMTTIEVQIAQVEFEKKRANDGIERNRHEQQTIETEINELLHQYQTVGHELDALQQRKTELEAKTTQATGALEALEVAFNEKSKAASDLEIKVVTVQGELRNAQRELERIDATHADIDATLSRRNEEITSAHDEIRRLTTEIDSQGLEVGTLKQRYETEEEHKQEIETTYAAKRNELHQIELKIKDERRLYDTSVAATHDLEMKITELKSNIDHLKLRAMEEFEVKLELKTYPEDEWVDFAQLREEVKNLKDRIRVLGAINFAAFDEFKTESERLTFMTQQRDDLLEAEKTLLSTIEEINMTAQRVFLETFGKIRENFIMIFKELFMEGDECDLKLEEGGDPLECNIEIIAKPRGKRPTSIDLLSGGEKTLTAIALLFAIYLVKPSPFCILDEVDAPLDDSNIDRYTRILKKFSNNTQFIVVTHNKRTMEAAQALYGVTMEEEGISKLVTVRFNEEARVQSATLASSS